MSGTFSERLKLTETPLLYRLYKRIMEYIFYIHDETLKTKFRNISFVETVLFPKIKPSVKSVRQLCLKETTKKKCRKFRRRC